MHDSLTLAETVATEARRLGIETALIGAAALAAHQYVRATSDTDLASYVDPFDYLRKLEASLADLGYGVELRLPDPDDDDPLAGVLVVWSTVDEDGKPVDEVEVVNFRNPDRPRNTPALRAIQNATSLDPNSPLRYVRLEDLIALKLYAGATKDHADIEEVLVRNPGADLELIREVASPFDRDTKLDAMIAASQRRR